MPRIVYVNGEYLPEQAAKVSVFDRAFLFADAVYEVTAVLDGALVDLTSHLDRLDRSLREIDLHPPLTHDELRELHANLIAENGLREGMVYLQVTRGPAEREFAYPEQAIPTVVAFTQAKAILDNPAAETGVGVVTVPDLRWRRRDIKSNSMLPQAMAKQAAKRAGANEAWMIEDGYITEGTSSSAFIVDADGVLRTQPLGHHLLPGLTRRAVLRLADLTGIRIEEKPFTRDEALAAREAFLTATSAFVLPVVTLDGHPIGGGRPGPVTRELRRLYIEEAKASREHERRDEDSLPAPPR